MLSCKPAICWCHQLLLLLSVLDSSNVRPSLLGLRTIWVRQFAFADDLLADNFLYGTRITVCMSSVAMAALLKAGRNLGFHEHLKLSWRFGLLVDVQSRLLSLAHDNCCQYLAEPTVLEGLRP